MVTIAYLNNNNNNKKRIYNKQINSLSYMQIFNILVKIFQFFVWLG